MFIKRAVCFLSDPIDCENDPCHLAWIVRDNRILLNAIPGAQCSNGTSFMNLNPSTLCSVNIYWYFYTYNWHNDSTILFTRSQKFERFVCPVPNGLFANPSSFFSFYQCSNTIPYKFVNDSNYYIIRIKNSIIFLTNGHAHPFYILRTVLETWYLIRLRLIATMSPQHPQQMDACCNNNFK